MKCEQRLSDHDRERLPSEIILEEPAEQSRRGDAKVCEDIHIRLVAGSRRRRVHVDEG